MKRQLGAVVQSCNCNFSGGGDCKDGGLRPTGGEGKKFTRPHFNQCLSVMVCSGLVFPATPETVDRRIMVLVGTGENLKNN